MIFKINVYIAVLLMQYTHMVKLNIQKGQTFHLLTVIKELDRLILPSGQTNRVFECKCKCGNIKTVRLVHLIRGRTKSCGCITTKSGKPRHYKCGTDIYKIWNYMRNRCHPNYFEKHLYFDKGIKVCDLWENDFEEFEKFALTNGYNKGLQIDRTDNSKGYNPDNCRFVNNIVNVNNRDNTFYVNYKGVDVAFMLLVRQKGLINQSSTIRARIKRGWSVDKAIDTFIRKGNYNTTSTIN